MSIVQLRDVVTPSDRAAVMVLRRGPGQDKYLNSMAEIFAEADESSVRCHTHGRSTMLKPVRWSAS